MIKSLTFSLLAVALGSAAVQASQQIDDPSTASHARHLITAPAKLSHADASWNYGHQYTYTVSSKPWKGKVFADPDISPDCFYFVDPVATIVSKWSSADQRYLDYPGIRYSVVNEAGTTEELHMSETLELFAKNSPITLKEWEPVNEPDTVGWVGWVPLRFTAPAKLSHADASWNYGHQYTYTVSSKYWEGKVSADPDCAPRCFYFIDPVATIVKKWSSANQRYLEYPGIRYSVVGEADTTEGLYMDETLELYAKNSLVTLKEWEPVNEPDNIGWVKKLLKTEFA